MFELMTALGAKPIVILRNVTPYLTFHKENKATDVDCGLSLRQKLGIINARNINNALTNSNSSFSTKLNKHFTKQKLLSTYCRIGGVWGVTLDSAEVAPV